MVLPVMSTTRNWLLPASRPCILAKTRVVPARVFRTSSPSLYREGGSLMGVDGGQHILAEAFQLLHEHLVGHGALVEV